MNPYMEFAHKTDLAYSALCHSLCRELHSPGYDKHKAG